jgi:hypothetical protein
MKICLFVALISLFVSNPVIIAAESNARNSPAREDLIGIWSPDKAAMQEIEKQAPNRARPEIELSSKGNIAMTNVPRWWRNVFGQPEGTVEGFVGGKWEIKSGKSGPQLLFQHPVYGSMALSIEGSKPPYSILLHVGGTADNAPVRFYRKSGELNPPK